jgi:transposase-like protein
LKVAYPGVDEDADFPKKGYAMKDTTIVTLRQPGTFSDDPLTDILRAGARQLLGQAIEAEVEGHIAAHADLTDAAGRRRIVRHGYLPEREIQTGIGAVAVKAPRVRDRDPAAPGGRIGFTSSILPRYLRRAKSMEELLPWLYLKGISSGDFGEALAALLGPDAPGLAASTIGRLKAVWWDELEAWQKRDLSARRYVYFWADGIYFSPRMEHDKQCVLVIIAADSLGNKDIVGLMDGYRESAQSWKELLLDLKRRGLRNGPELATGDGALGFWKALREVYGEAREQRCWVHKCANVLNRMPKSLQAKAKGHLQDIWMAETKGEADKAFDFFIEAYGVKYHKAVESLVKDRERLLTFYDFPAAHWKHIRTTNPIESTFATVRQRTVKTKGCLDRKTALAMTFKLILSARRKWRKLDGSNQLAELIEGVMFKDGIKLTKHAA